MSSGRSFIRSGLRLVWYVIAAAVILAAALMGAARLLLPHAGPYHADVARWVGAVLEREVEISGLDAGWHGFGPSIELEGVTIFDDRRRPLLYCRVARIDIDLLASLRHLQVELDRLTIGGARVSVLRKADGSLVLMGLDGLESSPDESGQQAFRQWLARQPRLAIEDSSLEWRDLTGAGRRHVFRGVRAELRNRDGEHRIEAELELPAELGRRLVVKADLRDDLFTPAAWNGAVYVRGAGLQLAAGGGRAWPAVDLRGGAVDAELWSEWRDGLQHVGGTLKATEVELAVHRAANGQSPAPSVIGAVQPDVAIAPAPGAALPRQETPAAPANGTAALNTTASSSAAGAQAAAEPQAAAGAAVPGPLVNIAAAQAELHWQRTADGWTLDADRVVLARAGGEPSPPARWRAVYREQDGSRHLEAGVSALRLEAVLPLVEQAGMLPEPATARLATMAPRGEVRDVYLRYRWGDGTAPALLLSGGFHQLGLTANEAVPGVTGLSGTLVSDGHLAVVHLQSGAGSVDAARLFRAPLPIGAISGHLAWRRLGDGWQLASDDLAFHNEDVRGRAALRLLHVDGLPSPYLALYADFSDGDGRHLGRYLPARIMHPKAIGWLDEAIVAGRITQGTAQVEGWLDRFPFDRSDGRFAVRFHVADGILDYAPGWPRLRDIDTEVLFAGRRLEVDARMAHMFDSQIFSTRVTVADLAGDPAVVELTGNARGPTADALRFIAGSPLRERFGDYLAGTSATGQSVMTLSLNLPLADKPMQMEGKLHFNDSSLSLREPALDITAINGSLGFYDAGLRAQDIHARLLDQPAVVGVRSENGGHTTVFEAQGVADAAVVANEFLPALADQLAGAASWRGTLRVAAAKDGGSRLQISSPLTGVTVKLPAPLGKAAADERQLLLELPLPLKGGRPIHVLYAGLLDGRLLLAGGEGAALRRGELRFGGGAAALPEEDVLRLRGRVSELPVSEWLALRDNDKGSGKGVANASGPAVDVVLAADVLRVMGQSFKDISVSARQAPAVWQVELDGAEAAGSLQVPEGRTQPITAKLARLHLAVPAGGAESAGAGSARFAPTDLPAMRIEIGDFRYGKLELGHVDLGLARSEHGIVVERFKAQSPLHKVNIGGRWEAEPDGSQRSVFALGFDSEDMGETLHALGYADVIKDGKMHTDMNLTWPGSPADLDLARAVGAVALSIKNGRLLEVNPGAGRVLGLLSFQALPRRLSLDFSDFFQKGFAFDRIEGDFAVRNGDARTDNLTMDGPAARIVARGRVGLTAEDYDQRVTVIPSVSAGLPLAGALAGGVAAGAALLLVERLLKQQIDEMGRIEYQVTGPWAAPVVERVVSSAKDTNRHK